MSDSDLITLLQNASNALASARHAARKTSLSNYLFNNLFPKRKRVEEECLNTLDTAIACITSINHEKSLHLETFRHALEGLLARHNASESQLANIEHITQHELARQTWVQDLQQQLNQSVTHSTIELAALRSAESSHSTRLAQIEQLVQHDIASKAQHEQAVQNLVQDLQRQLDQVVSRSATDVAALRSAESSHSARLAQIEQLVQHDIASKAQREQAVQKTVQDLQNTVEQNQRQTTVDLLALSGTESIHAQQISRLDDTIESLNKTLKRDQTPFDSEDFTRFYLAFENRYRGSENEIKDRLRVYLSRLTGPPPDNIKQKPNPIIDLGCGRGEWLQLLAEAGVPAIGVDTNPSMILSCQEKALTVVTRDALAYLRSLPEESAAAITAFHLIEHVPFPTLLELFKECLRVLVPGGLVIFETPSCHNILVGSSNFYLDPTHNHPLPNLLTTFALEHIGFGDIETLFLHPYPDNIRLHERNETTDRFNDYFYGAQDYAVIAHRPK